MPLYADLAAMQARFEERELVQLTDDAGIGAIDAARVDSVLASADALIIGYLAARYANTASLAGQALLTDIACDYAFSLLWKSDPPEWVSTRRKEAIRNLEAISAGRVKLDAGEETQAPRPGQIISTTSPRRFDRDSLGGF